MGVPFGLKIQDVERSAESDHRSATKLNYFQRIPTYHKTPTSLQDRRLADVAKYRAHRMVMIQGWNWRGGWVFNPGCAIFQTFRHLTPLPQFFWAGQFQHCNNHVLIVALYLFCLLHIT